MIRILKSIRPAFICFVMMTLICGVIYPGVVTGIAQGLFPSQSNGSVIVLTLKDGSQINYGSALLAQEFTKPEYLIGRPMGTTNLSAVSTEQAELVQKRIKSWHSLDPKNDSDIPMDLVTASGSGVDPNITPAAAKYQALRIAKERNISEAAVNKIIKKYTTGRFLGFWGEPAVNVLKVNLALDGLL